jgi:hypothetical protein
LPARIVGGKIIVRGGSGQVDPDGTLHSVGCQEIRGAGTFNRSNGCIGRRIAIKH